MSIESTQTKIHVKGANCIGVNLQSNSVQVTTEDNMPTPRKVNVLPTMKLQPVLLEKIRRIWDPPPEWISKEYQSRYIELATRFSARQIELEQQLLNLEKEIIKSMGEFYRKQR